ncbi:hypothetical protein VT84_09360 [Gemmata sp. SH-PL17]|uniref:hypothetical protein n=1 Tax=Gemmata sp. SH-PL17 TaxID=1630693 RepID=UPI00078D4981|nr:hypothetical protein [Gemmata sp. SH-PL17]AMV24591.1 hypothetical protein VT84_09360 [Gemmata sp. SH-PL17]
MTNNGYIECRPAAVSEDYTITITVEGTGSIASGWAFAGTLWNGETGQEVVGAVSVAITDAANRVITATIAGLNLAALPYYKQHRFEVRRTDDGARTVVAYGVLDLSDPRYTIQAAVLQRVADSLHVPVAQLANEWLSLSAQSLRDATADLTSIIATMGYSGAQIASADQMPIWTERLAAYFTLGRGAALASYDLKAVEWLDPRKMIKDMTALLIGGEPVAPGPSEVGGIGYGMVSAVCEAERRYGRY